MMPRQFRRARLLLIQAAVVLALTDASHAQLAASSDSLFDVTSSLESRSISWENQSGEPGQGGQAASKLGVGRKGAPWVETAAHTTLTLCNIVGSGTIRHFWITGSFNKDWKQLRSTVVRAYWDNQDYPSIECPLGDFMGTAHSYVSPYQSAVHSVGEQAGFNIWLPMPFTKRARIALSNDSDTTLRVYYQIDYTMQDQHAADVGRLHTYWHRENPTTIKRDFELLPKRTGKGRFIGALIGVRSLNTKDWWGEGEIKFFMDDDTEFPTICGTGSEDYVCQSYGVQERPYIYHGTSLNQDGFINMYRWHLLDPIYWKESCRVIIQQIGFNKQGLYERSDDWCAATFWYEAIPSAPLPDFQSLQDRMADIKPKPRRKPDPNTTATVVVDVATTQAQ